MSALPDPALEREGRELRDRLLEIMAAGVEAPLRPADFNELALEVFRFQARAVPVYGSFLRGRGVDPSAVEDFREVPPVPARAFKELTLVAGGTEGVEATFRTSGTTRDDGARGVHPVRDLELYRASLLPTARAYLNPGDERLRVLPLVPPFAERRESSLAYMVDVLVEEWGDGAGGRPMRGDWSLDLEGLVADLARAEDEGVAVFLPGTAFAFVHLLDELAGAGRRFRLPPGSRIMETGGFKGRSREVSRSDLYTSLVDRLGIPRHRIVNEYGMTELLSQFYEPVLRRRDDGQAGTRLLVGPPWLTTRVLDPETLQAVPPGRPGLLCHFDLANLYSVAPVLTEDLGVLRDGGLQLLGRTPEAEPRGCSLTMEELLAGRRGTEP